MEGMCKHFTVVFMYITIVYCITWLGQHPKVLMTATAVVSIVVAVGSFVYFILIGKAVYEAWKERGIQ